MESRYAPIASQQMRAGTVVLQPAIAGAPRVGPEDPAVSVMTDLLGEKPMQHLGRNGGRRCDIRVSELMTPASRLEVLAMKEVERSCVGHVLATLEGAGRQHAMVVEPGAGGREAVRGVFSASQLERQLGEPVVTGAAARTFAEIQAALSR